MIVLNKGKLDDDDELFIKRFCWFESFEDNTLVIWLELNVAAGNEAINNEEFGKLDCTLAVKDDDVDADEPGGGDWHRIMCDGFNKLLMGDDINCELVKWDTELF